VPCTPPAVPLGPCPEARP